MTAGAESWGAFLTWCVVGAASCFGVLSILTVGPFVLLATLTLTAFLLWRQELGWAMAGMVSGAGIPVLVVAWLNRDGPGEVCSRTPTQVSCSDQLSPWPFLAVGVLLLVGGVVVFARKRFG